MLRTGAQRAGRMDVALVGAILMVAAVVSGCDRVGPSPTTTATVPPSSTSSSTAALSSAGATDLDQVFTKLAADADPLVVFAPTYLPPGSTMPGEWWPVVEMADPDAYKGLGVANPRVLGAGLDSEIQVVLQVGKGWLAILENFHGDLGDVTGTPVGSVAGNPATLYLVDAAELVQWSVDGAWYGIFGRGVPEDEVIRTALGMRPTPVPAP